MSCNVPDFLRKQHGEKTSFLQTIKVFGALAVVLLALTTLLLLLPFRFLLNLADRLFQPRTSFMKHLDSAICAIFLSQKRALRKPDSMPKRRCGMPYIWATADHEKTEFDAYTASLHWVEHPDHPLALAADKRPPAFLRKVGKPIPDSIHARKQSEEA